MKHDQETVKEITGDVVSIEVIAVDGATREIVVVTDDGIYRIQRAATYTEDLKITTGMRPKYKEAWRVSWIGDEGESVTEIFVDRRKAEHRLKSNGNPAAAMTTIRVLVNDYDKITAVHPQDTIPF